MKTLLCSGQSNAVDHPIGGSFIINPRVAVWNCPTEVYGSTNLGSAFIYPNPTMPPFLSGGVNMFVKAASYIADILNEDVRLILVAHTGKPIDSWVGPNCTPSVLFDRIVAVMGAAGVTSVDGFGWMQGETYSPDYRAKFENLLILLKRRGFLHRGTPVVIGELAAKFTEMNATLSLLAMQDDNVHLARNQHFPVWDDVHFTGASKNRCGLNFASQFVGAWN